MEVTTSTRSRTRNSRRSCAETGQTLAEGSTFAPRQTSRSRRCSAPPSGPGGTSRTGAAAGDLYYPSVPCTTALLSHLLRAKVDFKLPIHNFAAGDPALEYIIKYATKRRSQDAAFWK